MGIFIDPTTLPAGTEGFIQLLFLLAAYGYVLFFSSGLISDGSELLLLVPSIAGIVGSCVLPVLGAVPDGAIVLFSGMGPNAQSQLAVGIGALAGSTIMLITLPWALSIIAGRVNINQQGQPTYKRPAGASANWSKLDPPNNFSLSGTGVLRGEQARQGGYIILLTSVSYLLIQGPAFALTGETDAEIASGEHDWAMVGVVVCTASFFGYLYYQWWLGENGGGDQLKEIKKDEIIKEKILSGENESTRGSSGKGVDEKTHLVGAGGKPDSYATALKQNPTIRRLESILRPFFDRYDEDKSGALDMNELQLVFRDLGDFDMKLDRVKALFERFDEDHSGCLEYREFVLGVYAYVVENSTEMARRAKDNGHSTSINTKPKQAAHDHSHEHGHSHDHDDEEKGEGNDEEEEEEEVPEDLKDLSPDEQQTQIKMRSFWMMALGTILVLIFSDPMVDVLNDLGVRTNISPFYVAFVLAPLASNASEILAAFNYSSKKTTKTIEISMATLEGAACMNNTFCLGIFMFLIYSQHLAWTFSAETTTILMMEIIVAVIAIKKSVHTTFDAFIFIALFPLSLVMVAWLESVGWD